LCSKARDKGALEDTFTNIDWIRASSIPCRSGYWSQRTENNAYDVRLKHDSEGHRGHSFVGGMNDYPIFLLLFRL